MKKILYFVMSLGLLMSCDMDLGQQPISDPAAETYFQTVDDFNQGLNAVYSSARGYPDRLMNLSETRSDNLYAVSDGGVRDWEGVNSFHQNIAANPYIVEAWQTNFTGIFRANNYLEQLAEKGEAVILEEDVRRQMEGQARFLRAFYYFDLIRYFGKVPLIDRVVDAPEAKTIPRSPVSDVYNLIIEDLNTAIDYLPAPSDYAAADKGRANKYSAKMLLGLVYMTRSGPDLGIEGAGLNSNEWDEAVKQFNDIIASNEFELLPSYARIFDYTNENNEEVIFNIEYATGSNPAVGSTFPWVLVPDTWFRSLGFGAQGGLTIRPVSTELVDKYETDDVRRGFSIQEGYEDGDNVETRPFIKKFVDISRVPITSRTDWPINYIVFRYTDLLMLKAECVLNGASGSTDTDVDDIVNFVRERAGLTSPLTGVTKAQLLEERRREFIGEGIRWFDLIRSGTVENTMNTWIEEEDTGGQMRDFQIDYVLYPVPQSEMNTAPGLYDQNNGY
ncbi:RagB/SusD family nutrient uptake outer membrane protein [Sphingobacterium arenae]|uniref:RagB/SusD family nutrient uptake outer membrane protein n=1 Tax=Sphingobacterium arenae TaxID=1280598 RepID=A0ABR7Y049_9SPHI|nr:RagB/SusD family nutrient uptake outer membrane protein [Sphingobacterium arenae]MBD1424686.1 RagB/SusD family nutrient uptake outer membrane protein [Sphingobacterium arenae]